ncbi:hypothetical protein ACPRNU_25480 [Chromobacterium vaccinii]|uniref:hypothetical protein n=1 Tax=Chromobacterium TaxID=535 RepID=UPI0013052A5C|nr:hypothetical protein [Chromobacterium sp. ATCC 53434]
MKSKCIKMLCGFALCFVAGGTVAEDSLKPEQYPVECQPSRGTVPSWLNRLIQQGHVSASSYVNQFWYKDWLSTTLSTCTDLSEIDGRRFNDGKLNTTNIYWRTDSRPQFRGGSAGKGRDVSDIFVEGIYPWKYDGELLAFSGISNHNSGLVNTGYNAYYIFGKGYGVAGGGVGFIIDAPGGINQGLIIFDPANKTVNNGSLHHLPDTTAPQDIQKKGHDTIVFPGGVRAEYIKGAFKQNATTHNLEYFSNPHYRYPAPLSNEFDLVMSDPMSGDEKYDKGSIEISSRNITTSAAPQGKAAGGVAYRYMKGESVTVSIKEGRPDYCWYVNMKKRSTPTTAPLVLTMEDQTLPVAVVYRDKCQ